jgi:hypothetical protein
MSDEAERILAELLARPGAPTRDELDKQARAALAAEQEQPDAELVLLTMISIAARDDAEADELLARAQGIAPAGASVH